MRSMAIAALLGSSSLLFLATLPNLDMMFALLAMLSLLYWRWRFFCLRFFLIAICALIYATWNAQQRLAWRLPKPLENTPVLVRGTIASLPVQHSLYTTFLFMLTRLAKHHIPMKKIKLNWYGPHPHLTVGDVWQLRVKMKRIHTLANPGGFDQARYFLQQNIRASGYVRRSTSNRLLDSQWHQLMWLH